MHSKNSRARSLCVFCASSSNVDQTYKDLAATLGLITAQGGFRLVYGGAQGGLMGMAADSALEAGGEVVGVMPEILSDRERAHKGLSELHITKDMHERQKTMAELADMFLILPGGMGTLAEFFEILTWKALGLHEKSILVLNFEGFWDHLLDMLDRCNQQGFLHHDPKDLFIVLNEIEDFQSFLASK